MRLEAHGGYLCRFEELDAAELVGLAREALLEDGGNPEDCSLLVSALERPMVLRLAYDGPHTYGRRGARWYETHHALARRLSQVVKGVVHAYVFDPDELEQVVGFGAGRKVGGERTRYEDAELPGEGDEELDEASFEKLKARWPLGHLARVLGVPREELVRIARAPAALFELDGREAKGRVGELFPLASGREAPRRAQEQWAERAVAQVRRAASGSR
ncbi:MAG: hypothetical protein ACYC8T_09985 [Myxococcaceae bacterium]